MEFDPSAWAAGTAALKSAFDMFRSAIGLARDLRPSSTPAEQQAVAAALNEASSAAALAEAQIAKGLGYELCRCEFPPTIMLTVGHIDRIQPNLRGQVYECPKCGYNTAGSRIYRRTGGFLSSLTGCEGGAFARWRLEDDA